MSTINQATLDSISRNPREWGFGLFVSDAPQFGGAQGFARFGTEAAALGCLRTELADIYYPAR